MPIIGFGFEKIHIERSGVFTKEDQLKNRLSIINIEETKVKTSANEDTPAILIKFEFGLEYGKAGDLELKGYVLYYDSKEKIQDLVDTWKKIQKLPAAFSAQILNFVLTKSNLQALQLESEVGLPLHLKMPKFKIERREEKATK